MSNGGQEHSRGRRAIVPTIVCALAACAGPRPVIDATSDASTDASADASTGATSDAGASDGTASADGTASDAGRRARTDAMAPPRCYGISSSAGLLTHVAEIPRESGGLSNGASGCVGDVDNDGRKEFILLRMSEPSELIGADLCSRGRVLLPEHARDCIVADIDETPGNELVIVSNVGWTAESQISVGRVERTTASDWTAERFAWRARFTLDERRPIAPIGGAHVAVTDLDRDGRRELVASGNFAASFIRAWDVSARGDRATELFSQDLSDVLDDSNGWVVGDLDADGAPEALALGGCTHAGRHFVRTFESFAPARFTDTDVNGPVSGALADLDGTGPLELVLAERVHCAERRPVPTASLQVRRFDPATGRLALVTARVTENAARESSLVAALDVAGSPAQEILHCTASMTLASPPRTCRLYALSEGMTPELVAIPSAAAPFVWTSAPRRAVLSSVLVDDLDGDGAREVFVMGQEHVDVLRGPRR